MRRFQVSAGCLFVVSIAAATWAQSTLSVASAGTDGSNQNLCIHEGPTRAACSGKAQSVDHLAVGGAASGATSSYSSLGISGSATVSNNGGSGLTMEADANATLNDSFVITNLTQASYFFVSIASTASGTSEAYVSEVVNLSGGGSCGINLLGQQNCSTSIPIAPPSSSVDLSIQYIGIAGVNCLSGCGAGLASFDAKSPRGGKILAVMVTDANGNPVQGVSVTSASGHIYPSRFASATALTSSQNPSTLGQSVTFTATVSSFGRSSSPTRKVTFKDSKTKLGTAVLSGGVATFTTSSLSIGTHSITASYVGDPLSSGSHSAPLSQVVN